MDLKKYCMVIAVLGTGIGGPDSEAKSILSVNFTHTSTGSGPYDDLSGFGPTAVAGAGDYAASNWNHMFTDWSGNAVNNPGLASLVTSTGAAVTFLDNISYSGRNHPIQYDSANTWRSGIANATVNHTLMNGYLDDGFNNQPYANFDVKYDGEAGADGIHAYDVVLYIHGDRVDPVGRYWLEDFSGNVLTDQVGIRGNDWLGTFIQAGGADFFQTDTPGNVDVDGGNYLVFKGITADTIRVRSAGNGDPEDFGRGPLNAIQLIAVPSPSAAIVGLAGLGFLAARRRRGQ